ncbi:hypothetical protein WOLCODRAFT_28246 [Wolfiporia cocos MD-104 SS10]|uniref:Uncharacterized protein n=1 Tax=Wolfiporia cocos (strain MD-104) TaxID=742152 RepID=A0A2H3J1W2_WOLCO|nr:hypothetical protein WOLCODRAFT_28246 [Wolfiporia cocos MD-104 SS10]
MTLPDNYLLSSLRTNGMHDLISFKLHGNAHQMIDDSRFSPIAGSCGALKTDEHRNETNTGMSGTLAHLRSK